MDFSSANTSLWNPIIQLGVIAVLILFSNVLRRKIKFVRTSLIPTAVLAGFILLLLRTTGLVAIDTLFLEKLTYHALAFGFIALSLRVPTQQTDSAVLLGSKSGALIVSTYLVQAIAGLAISLLLGFTIMPDLFKASGILLPMAYGQGPGQANNVGSTYETLGMAGGRSFGLSLSAAGYLCACIVGVIYLNILNRKKKICRADTNDVISGSVTVDAFQDHNEIPVSESVDKLSIQFALVAIVYLATYLVIVGLTTLLNAVAPGLASTVSTLLWGFNFIIGSMLAIACRSLFKALHKTKVMNRQYQNNYLLSRISGLAFDLMIIAGIAGIEIDDLSGYWIPFILMAVVGGVVTFVYLKIMCKKLYPGFEYEGFFGMFGMLTGTISSGVLLLREVDPEFKTPASDQLINGSSFGIAFAIPILLLVSFAAQDDTSAVLTLVIAAAYFAALLLYITKLGKRKKAS